MEWYHIRMLAFVMILVSFFMGALPFSVWLTRIFLGHDVRQYGDGNPGAANAFRTGNYFVGLFVLLLDISKAAAPIGVSYFNLQIRGVPMFLIAIAPMLGHMFSPFLAFKGGKAIAAALGVWIGLTIWKASVPGAAAVIIGIILFTSSGWAVMLALTVILITILLWLSDFLLISIWIAETLLLAWTHHTDLSHAPHLRPWLINCLRKPKG